MELFHWCTNEKNRTRNSEACTVLHKYNILFTCHFLDKKCLLSTEVIPVYCVFFLQKSIQQITLMYGLACTRLYTCMTARPI
jgi:hypothetical protein